MLQEAEFQRVSGRHLVYKTETIGLTCGIVLYNMPTAKLDMSVATAEEEGRCDRSANTAGN